MKEKVEQAYKAWKEYAEHVEPHKFKVVLMQDIMIERAYNDLQKNWDDVHAFKFINGISKILGIIQSNKINSQAYE